MSLATAYCDRNAIATDPRQLLLSGDFDSVNLYLVGDIFKQKSKDCMDKTDGFLLATTLLKPLVS
jgi:hypothetical protein